MTENLNWPFFTKVSSTAPLKVTLFKYNRAHVLLLRTFTFQVDAHATLGEGVVVQVSGELSNRGHPMRRFMQTFVLAPQSPKKYYVINDIFRYQVKSRSPSPRSCYYFTLLLLKESTASTWCKCRVLHGAKFEMYNAFSALFT